MNYVEPIRSKRKIEDMKRYLKGYSLRDYALFVLGINSGLRISDILKLKTADVTTPSGKLRTRLEIKEKKTEKIKEFPLSPAIIKSLEEYLTDSPPKNEWLFPSRKGSSPLDRRQAWRIIATAAAAVGISDRIGTHTLRKTFAYWAVKRGTDITRIQKLLNHSSPAVTLTYIGITKDELDEVYLESNL